MDRIKKRVQNWWWFKQIQEFKDNPKWYGRFAQTPKRCSKPCCNRARLVYGPTMQELCAPRIEDWEDDFDSKFAMQQRKDELWTMYDSCMDMDAINDED